MPRRVAFAVRTRYLKTTTSIERFTRFLTLVQFISIRRAWLRAVRYPTGFHYRRNEALLSRLRHERDRGPGAAGCARRPQARSPSDPLFDARERLQLEQTVSQVRPRGRRCHR